VLSLHLPFRKACDLPPLGDRFNLHHRGLSLPRFSVGSSVTASAASLRAGLNLADHQVSLPQLPLGSPLLGFPRSPKLYHVCRCWFNPGSGLVCMTSCCSALPALSWEPRKALWWLDHRSPSSLRRAQQAPASGSLPALLLIHGQETDRAGPEPLQPAHAPFPSRNSAISFPRAAALRPKA
jgi:hypothetical protein